MSSLVRTLQKRQLKQRGFHRNKLTGLIEDLNGTVYGKNYPMLLNTETK